MSWGWRPRGTPARARLPPPSPKKPGGTSTAVSPASHIHWVRPPLSDSQHIDDILGQWRHEAGRPNARIVPGGDGRDVIQLRIDMGVLQMEVEGRPDGRRPHGAETYHDFLISQAVKFGDEFTLTEEHCVEIDREFIQFYHRRISWLALHEYGRAADDAKHSLDLMDFCRDHSPDEQWTLSHEQYRPFVLFHHTHALALWRLDEEDAEAAIQVLNEGLDRFRELYAEFDAEEQLEEDELAEQLVELRESLRERHNVGRTLHERLADAVAAEEYELAAKLRDQITRRPADLK